MKNWAKQSKIQFFLVLDIPAVVIVFLLLDMIQALMSIQL